MDTLELQVYLQDALDRAKAEFAAANKARDQYGIAHALGTMTGSVTCALIELKYINRRAERRAA